MASVKISTTKQCKKDILSTLAYFDIFQYPLTRREIISFLPNMYANTEFDNALHELLASSSVFKPGEFFSLRNNYSIEQRRKKGNEKARRMMITAKKVASLLSKFPYVRGVGISGSLSKNFADENSDIDLFIITAKNKLWIARSFLYLLLKISIVFKKQHLFCMNYFIDETALEIEEKNIYTAIEIVTLIPLQGSAVFQKFFAANNWTKKVFPNNYLSIATAKPNRIIWFKWIIEKIYNNPVGDWLDTFLLTTTAKRWNSKTAKKVLTKSGLLFSVKTSKHYAKHDPSTFQDKIVLLHEQKIYGLQDQNKIKKATGNLNSIISS